MIEQDLTILTVTLRSGRVDTYQGVFTLLREGALLVFTFTYLDPAEWRKQRYDDAVEVVRGYSLAAVESWTEPDYEGPPYIILPDSDHGLPFDRADTNGVPLGTEGWRP